MSDLVSINLHIPRYQKDYCDTSRESIKDLYINAFNLVYLKEMKKLKDLKELEKKVTLIKKEIKQEKNKPFNYEEIQFLRESVNVVSKGTLKKLIKRFDVFQKLFARYYMNIDDFKQKVREYIQ